MSYFVTVTFDIEKGKTEDYDNVYQGLAAIGLRKQVSGSGVNGQVHTLPSTTTAGEFSGNSASAVRDDIANRVEAVFKNCGVSGQIFAAIGGDWAWSIRYPKNTKAAIAYL